MNEQTIAEVFTFLTAHGWVEVKEAFKRLNRDLVRNETIARDITKEQMLSIGWVEHQGDIPKGWEWRKIGHKLFVRDPSSRPENPGNVVKAVGTRQKAHKKTDTGVKRVADLKCPQCGGELFREGICPGCEDGRKGLKVRLLCGECEYTLAL